MESNWNEDAEYRDWEDHVRKNIVPLIEGSAVTISRVPTGDPDIRFAVELGLSILMDKPIIALVATGTKIPDGLAKVADELVEVDIMDNPDGAKRSISAAFSRVMAHRASSHVRLDEDADE